jgi:hypothetical protein
MLEADQHVGELQVEAEEDHRTGDQDAERISEKDDACEETWICLVMH